MRIIGFNLTKISGERKQNIKEKLEIKQNINIDDVSKETIPISKEEAIKIEFTFSIKYGSEFATIEFKGQIIALPDKDELKDILKEWKNKTLPETIKTGVFNFIMSKCNIKAVSLEDEMSLPIHIPMPKITPKKEE
jgi:hypothetical protein